MIYISLLLMLLIFKGVNFEAKKNVSLSTINTHSLYTDSPRLVITVTSALLFFWFFYAVIIMGLRGGFAADYDDYALWFHRINSMGNTSFWECFGIKNLFSVYLETGYALINRMVGYFTNDPIWLFFVCAIIICFPVFMLFRNSEKPWLAVLLWISIGPYLESFNTMRGAMAASILIFSLKYMQERKIVKYIIVVLIATTFHSIAILMLLAYFLPLIKPSKKSVLFIIMVVAVAPIFSEILVIRYNNFFHIAFTDAEAISMLYKNRSSGASLLIPLLIELLTFYLFFDEARKGEINMDDIYIRMMFNGNLIWIFFELLLIVTSYSTRFAMLFFYYPCILIPFLIGKRKNSKTLYILIMVMAVSWYLVNVLIRQPAYYFAI